MLVPIIKNGREVHVDSKLHDEYLSKYPDVFTAVSAPQTEGQAQIEPDKELVAELQKDVDSLNKPVLEDLSYEKLKGIAKSKELEFAGNIGKVKLIELIKGSQVE